MEAVVSRGASKDGNGRADGLVAMQHGDGSITTAALEAKSSRTRKNVKPIDSTAWGRDAILLVVGSIVLASITGYVLGSWLWFGGVGLTLLIASLVYATVTTHPHYYFSVDVIAQVKRYPANEHWIALPKDLYTALTPEAQERLKHRCQGEGIGLLVVSRNNKVSIETHAVAHRTPRHHADLLECYVAAAAMRQELQAQLVASVRPVDSQELAVELP